MFLIFGLDQAVQNVNELNAYHGLDQAARNKALFLDHKDRAARERGVFHNRSSARGNAHLPNSPLI
jgi:tRNA (Thr-GGU) A37 N-methylase